MIRAKRLVLRSGCNVLRAGVLSPGKQRDTWHAFLVISLFAVCDFVVASHTTIAASLRVRETRSGFLLNARTKRRTAFEVVNTNNFCFESTIAIGLSGLSQDPAMRSPPAKVGSREGKGKYANCSGCATNRECASEALWRDGTDRFVPH